MGKIEGTNQVEDKKQTNEGTENTYIVYTGTHKEGEEGHLMFIVYCRAVPD